jgi:hypothetical protein
MYLLLQLCYLLILFFIPPRLLYFRPLYSSVSCYMPILFCTSLLSLLTCISLSILHCPVKPDVLRALMCSLITFTSHYRHFHIHNYWLSPTSYTVHEVSANVDTYHRTRRLDRD